MYGARNTALFLLFLIFGNIFSSLAGVDSAAIYILSDLKSVTVRRFRLFVFLKQRTQAAKPLKLDSTANEIY